MRSTTIIRIAVLGAIIPAIASAQPFLRHNWGTVADLPAVSASSPGRIFTVTDGADESDCEVGGGSESVMCRDTGIAWVAVGSGGDAGTVTSVSLTAPSILSVSGSPVTTSGTLAVSLATQAANRVFAGPTTGADAAPTFRALVSADVPNNAADTTGNAATATALAANGANCGAGQAAAGVDASGASEGCAAYLADITGETIGDLSDVDETGASTGEALVSDGAGSWAPSAAAVCLSNGTNCPSAAAVSIADLTSGTNTSAAMVVGAGSSLKIASTGTIDASGIDADGDGTRNVRMNGSTLEFDPDDDGVAEASISSAGILSATVATLSSLEIGNEGAIVATQAKGMNLIANADTGIRIAPRRIGLGIATEVSVGVTVDSSNRSVLLFCERSGNCNRDTAAVNYTAGLRLDSGRIWVTDAAVTSAPADGSLVAGDIEVTGDLNLSGAGGLARLGAMSGALPTCDAATARAVVFDQTGDLCACPPDGSDWYDVSHGYGTPGDCA